MIAENTRNMAGGSAPEKTLYEILNGAKIQADQKSDEEKANKIIQHIKTGLAAMGGE